MMMDTKDERKRIVEMIHDFCRGESMIGKACMSCPLKSLNVCDDKHGNNIYMSKLWNAEKIINEVMSNG